MHHRTYVRLCIHVDNDESNEMQFIYSYTVYLSAKVLVSGVFIRLAADAHL